jgi:glycosyltransferase involved in cell wall biosynthesis
VAAPTRAVLTALERHYGPLPATQVIPNGREPADFPPGAKEPFLFSAGRLWDEAKNVAAVAHAAEELPWPTFVAGAQSHPSGSHLELRNVQCLGRLTSREMAEWLGHASLYVLPARYEPFGLSALEAALAGCALVLGDIPSLREVWGDAALFVDPDDPGRLRTELLRLIEDPVLRQEMARRARTRAFEYTPQRMGKGYLAAYRWLLTAAEREPSAQETEEEILCAS